LWLFKGSDHFFFTCTKFNKDLNKEYLQTGATAGSNPNEITNFCNIKSLFPTYPVDDNISIILRPLECATPPTKDTGAALDPGEAAIV
jgi:hypothetical protein